MPQPIASDRVHYDLDSTKLATDSPELAAHLMVITSLWNLLEDNVTGLLVSMLARRELVASSSVRGMFNSVISADARGKMINSVAAMRLTKADQKILDTILKKLRILAGERADYVHGNWAVCTIPKAILRIPRPADFKIGKPSPKFFIYKERDFEATEKRIADLNTRVIDFSISLVGRRTPQR